MNSGAPGRRGLELFRNAGVRYCVAVKNLMRIGFHLPGLVALAGLLCLAACEDSDPSDHTPPAGMGAIIVNNQTYNGVDVYIDGVRQKGVDNGHDRAYDLSNGVHRVVLDEDGGSRTFSGDIDVLQDRNTVLDVTNDPYNWSRYDVFIYYDKP